MYLHEFSIIKNCCHFIWDLHKRWFWISLEKTCFFIWWKQIQLQSIKHICPEKQKKNIRVHCCLLKIFFGDEKCDILLCIFINPKCCGALPSKQHSKPNKTNLRQPTLLDAAVAELLEGINCIKLKVETIKPFISVIVFIFSLPFVYNEQNVHICKCKFTFFRPCGCEMSNDHPDNKLAVNKKTTWQPDSPHIFYCTYSVTLLFCL